jgi:hypothetical protein
MHIKEVILRSYLDNMVTGAQRQAIETHLASCSKCSQAAEQMRSREQRVNDLLNKLAPPPSSPAITAQNARAHLTQVISQKEANLNPMNKLFTRSRFIIYAALAVLILATALTLPPVRAIANSFLGLFRVEQVAVVPINPANIPDLRTAGIGLERMLADNVEVEQFGQQIEAISVEQAAAASGITVRLPDLLPDPDNIQVEPGTRVTYTIDLPKLQALLEEMGMSGLNLPRQINGEKITADMSPIVVASFGACSEVPERLPSEDRHGPSNRWNPDCKILFQMQSPTITAPPGLDIESLGEAFLQLAGMTGTEAEQFSASVDWQTTLVVPIPPNAKSQEVAVDGVKGTLVYDSRSTQPQYALIWVKDGILYALSGSVDIDSARLIANSMQ